MDSVRLGFSLALCFIESVVLGGAGFGWPSLVYVLEGDKLYSDLCKSSNETYADDTNTVLRDYGISPTTTGLLQETPEAQTCIEQKVRLSDSYTVASAAYGLVAFPMGIFFDRFGLRATRTIICLVGMISYVLLAFTVPGREWLVMLGAILTAPSCYGLVMTNMHVALLGGNHAAKVTGIFMAGVDSSFAFTAVKIAYDHGVPKMYTLLGIGCVYFLVLFTSWTILPRFKVKFEGHQASLQASEPDSKGSTKDEHTTKENGPSPSENVKDGMNKKMSKMEIIKTMLTPTYILYVFWFCAVIIRICITTNGLDAWLTDVLEGDHNKVSFFINMLAYFNFFEVGPCFIAGYITDKMIAKFGSQPGGLDLALIPVTTLASLVSIAGTIPMYFRTEAAIYCTLVFVDLTKPMFFTAAHSFLSFRYPPEIFGVIYGTVYFIMGLGMFLMNPYMNWVAKAGSFIPMNTFIFVSLVISLTLPLKLFHNWWHLQRNSPEKQMLLSGKNEKES